MKVNLSDDLPSALDCLEKGDVQIVMEIPKGYGEAILNRTENDPTLFFTCLL